MGIFYLKEHVSCQCYTRYIQEGFTLHMMKKGETIEERLSHDCILFVLKGGLHIFYNEFEFLLPAEKMVCFCRERVCRLYCMEECTLVIAQFEHSVSACDKLSFARLSALGIQIPNKAGLLPIRRELMMFLDLVFIYLEAKANCIHLHEIKIKELFWQLRFYYTWEELAAFFYPIQGNDRRFRSLVLQNCKKIMPVKMLAKHCNLSLSSFNRKFLDEFGEPASEWLSKQIDGMVRYRLSDMDTPLIDIADDLGFKSLSYFCQYCKRRLGVTPKEWRKLFNERREGFSKIPTAISSQMPEINS